MKPANSFTSGPWKLETESRSADGSDLLVTTPDGAWNIADCRDHNGLGVDDVSQAEANARLIAAAPDLVDALLLERGILLRLAQELDSGDLLARVNTAIGSNYAALKKAGAL